jgi:hypothetical protein
MFETIYDNKINDGDEFAHATGSRIRGGT